MKLSVCTISFRHQLISLKDIAQWARANNFQGIELWGVHAKNLQDFPEYNCDWLKSYDLSVSMLSDYLPLYGDKQLAIDKTTDLCRMANIWNAKKLRTFAGDCASDKITASERKQWAIRMRELCNIAQDHGLNLVMETHPNTLADTLASTLQFIEEVDHPALKVNFDVIHVWEMGSDPVKAFQLLAPAIVHVHLKNISERKMLDVFSPMNVYAPSGSRVGMVKLFDGQYDFSAFIRFLMSQSQLPSETIDASLEWFGGDVLTTLAHDCRALVDSQGSRYAQPVSARESDLSLA